MVRSSVRGQGHALVAVPGALLLLAMMGAAGADHGSAAARGAAGNCTTCHGPAGAGDHPVGVIPSMPVPADLPLVHGRIGCATCHLDQSDLDQSMATHLQATATGDPLLRAEGRTLCMRCHDTSAADTSAVHALVLDRAHLRPHDWPHDWTGTLRGRNEETGTFRGRNEQTGTSIARGPGVGERLDPVSVGCLSCHDGSLAGDGARDPLASPFPGLGHGHPVGVGYGPRGGRLGETALHPAWRVDRRIRLFDGTVGCGTCHSLYSPEPNLLVMPNDRSELCLSCHDV